MSAAIIQSGDYDLVIDTGYDAASFRLDNDLKGVLDGPYTLGPATNYASVIDGTTNIRVMRGRKNIGDQFSAGTMTFILNDSYANGAFNPFNVNNQDPANDLPGIAPLREVILSREGEELFVGYIVDYDYSFGLDQNNTVTVYCADRFYLLAQTLIHEYNVSEELSSARVTNVLNLPEVDYPTGAAYRSIATGTQTLGGSAAYTVPEGTNVKYYLDQIQQAEQGRIFMSRDGVLTFQSRLYGATSVTHSDFSDDGDPAHLPFDRLGISFGADQVVNLATVSTLQDPTTPQSAQDSASQSKYFIQAQSILNSLLHNNTAALTLANYLLVGEPSASFSDVSTLFAMLTDAQRDELATIDIGETVAITKSIEDSATTTSEVSQISWIEGVEHNISLTQGHRMTIYTVPTIYFQLILDSAVYGTISTVNVLA
jgi:hypothetical protein